MIISNDHSILACQFFDAYKELRAKDPPNWPKYFLAGHAVELALKAYLLQNGVSASYLRKVGHDIGKLSAKSQLIGLNLDERTIEDLIHLNFVHVQAWQRYPRAAAYPVVILVH